MENNIKRPLHYIRKNRQTEVVIYLKDNDDKAAQRLLCRAYAIDLGYEIVGETTNIEDVKDCNVVLITSASTLTRDVDEFYDIVKKFKRRGIEVEVALSDDAGRYVDFALELFRKGRI